MKDGQMYSRCAATERWILQGLPHKIVFGLISALLNKCASLVIGKLFLKCFL
jgi:hypothetical protein